MIYRQYDVMNKYDSMYFQKFKPFDEGYTRICKNGASTAGYWDKQEIYTNTVMNRRPLCSFILEIIY